MPNHVTHRVVVTGPEADIAAFKAIAFVAKAGEDTEPNSVYFDFNAFIPMPKCLEGTVSGSETQQGLAVLGRDDVPCGFGRPTGPHVPVDRLAEMLRYPWVAKEGLRTKEQLKAFLLEKHHDCIEIAKRTIAAFEETGFPTWYEWAIEKWGTKWNSYSFDIKREVPGEIEFVFDTAWSVPRPVLAAIAAAFPTLAFLVEAFDEGGGFGAIGRYVNGAGAVAVDRELGDDRALYERVYGHKMPVYDDDGEEVERDLKAGA